MASVSLRTGPSPWAARLVTLALWALAAASVVVWGLRLSAPASGMAAATAAPALPAPDPQAIGRLLGAVSEAPSQALAPATASRFALIGVLAGKDGSSGAALIAVGGEPARTFRIGAPVDGDLVLQSVGRYGVELGLSGAAPSLKLAFPALP